ncbi:MAG TPA: hypothetical protein VGK99_20670 [Acidobacteriota bacterium]|jgi:hypothetical protein
MTLNKKGLLVLAGVLAVALAAFAGTQIYQNSKAVEVPAGTAIRVSLDHSVSSASSREGDAFSATVADPVVVDGKTVIPSGARAQGMLTGAQRSGRLSGHAYVGLTLTSVEIDGRTYDLNTTSVSRINKGGHTKRNWGWIGGGAAGGALIGALAGGGKGALIGGPIGAGGGLAVAAITGKKSTGFSAGQELSFRLTEPIKVRAS